MNWKRENVFEYGCDCDHPTYVKSDWFNGTVHNSSWFATEAQKTVIIGGTWYQSETTWIDENQYYCSYKNETKLMQKNAFDFSGSDSDLFSQVIVQADLLQGEDEDEESMVSSF